MTPQRSRILLGLGLLAVATALLWSNAFQRTAPLDTPPTAPENSANRAVEHGGAEVTFATGTPEVSGTPRKGESPSIAASVDLAQLSVPELLDLLGDRARAGDPLASCELATALHTCRFELLSRNMIRPPPPANASEAELEEFVNFHAGYQERRARDAERCAGVGTAALSESVQFSATAALAGHVDSLNRFMWSPTRDSTEFLRDPNLANLYRTQLWPTLRRAFAAGHIELSHAVLTHLAQSADSPLKVAVPEAYRDQQIAFAVLALTMDEAEALTWLEQGQSLPTPAATEIAARWVNELFGGQVPDLSDANLARRREAGQPGGLACDSTSAWLPR